MKTTLLLITTYSFLLLGCVHNRENITQNSSNIYLSEKSKEPGGNPEVFNLHTCLIQKDTIQQKSCIKNNFGNKNMKIYLAKNLLSSPVYQRGDSQEIRTFNLKGKDEFVLHLNLKPNIGKITTNIENAKIYQRDNKITILMKTKDIFKNIILYNEKKEVLIKYMVEK